MKLDRLLGKTIVLYLMLICVGFSPGVVLAAAVTLTNPSFEQPGTGTEVTVWDSIPGWDSNPGNNGLYKGYNPTDGLWTCYVQGNAYTVFQEPGHTIISGKTYYLTLDAKAQTGSGVQITMSCWKGPDWGSKTLITSSDLSVSSTMAEKEISFNSTAHAGQQLIISFECTGSSSSRMIAVDNVRVTYSLEVPDTDAPTPEPATFAFTPAAISDTAITMTAIKGSDPSGPIQYYFDETSGNPSGSDSGWQTSSIYTDTDLDPNTQYTYTVQMRDSVPNTGTSSGPASATTQSGGSGIPIPITNPSFESGSTGWSGATSDNSEYYAAPDGTSYATSSGGAGYTSQMTGHTIAAGETYTLTVWARSINAAANSNATNAEVRFYYGSSTITAVTQDVYPVRLSGAPATIHQDDGGNVWLDGNYRMACANIFYQTIDKDPINDPWSDAGEQGYDCGQAPIMTPQGFDAIMGCACYTEDPIYSCQQYSAFTGNPPFYNHSYPSVPVLSHEGDEDPWVIDAHLYYDYATSRLWMTWGGGGVYVSELDPYDGELIDHPSNHEFDTHPSWYHTKVAVWGGDQWSSNWVEGPSLYKHNGYWYLFTTCGNMNANYTIRMGRGTSPTGPFYDKDGVGLMEFDFGENRYGNSIMLGDEGEYLVPGHPHLWEENGTYYMGYDYRPNSTTEPDIMGIRRLYWVNGWPTIWTPITVTFNADDYPSAIGQTLGISLRNTGSGSNAAFDYVSLTYTPSPPPTPDMDGSGDVNFVDYSLFTAQWMRTDCNDCNGADFTNDGNNVDYNDLDIFVDNWLRDYGLLGYWHLDGDANDSSGYGNDGTVQGGAGWLDDPNRGWCLSLGGGGDYVQIPADVNLNVGKITMAAWVKASNAAPATAMHLLNRQMTQPGTYVLWLTGAAHTYQWGAQIRLDGAENNAIQIYSNDAATTDWTHIAATYDGSAFKMYINGILQTDTAAAVGSIDDDNSGIFTIGAHPDPKNYFAGLIDEVIIYDKLLNQQQIEALAGI